MGKYTNCTIRGAGQYSVRTLKTPFDFLLIPPSNQYLQQTINQSFMFILIIFNEFFIQNTCTVVCSVAVSHRATDNTLPHQRGAKQELHYTNIKVSFRISSRRFR